ncbi:sugar kinase [Phyllobacterium sp. SB3]|uniref:carbohydrate kinase family protein n=1 Tax=Phyllobacterium sp. SB3 TaxID=3156073 RepID=UPI0032AF33F0
MKYQYSSVGFYTFDCLGRPITELPKGGGVSFVEEITLAVSGTAGSCAIDAAKLGLKTLAVGAVGQDPMGLWVMQQLESHGVDTSAMQVLPESRTSTTIVTTRPDGARPALHMRGATGDFIIPDEMLDQVLDTDVLHLGGTGLMNQMDGPRSVELLKEAKRRGCVTTHDLLAGTPDFLPLVEQLMPYVDYFIPSIEEAEGLSGLRDMKEIASFFVDKGAKCCVLTLGGVGVYYHHSDGTRFLVPAFDVDVVCTCGCGDAFDAGFAAGICKGFDPETSVRFGQAAAALVATGLGSQAGIRSFDQTLHFMNTAAVKAERRPADRWAV